MRKFRGVRTRRVAADTGVTAVYSVINASLRFRLLVIALAAGITVLGILQLSRTPVDVLPETSPVVVDIQTEAAGLSAPEGESQAARSFLLLSGESEGVPPAGYWPGGPRGQ
jgi:AcrB/AcrD/AcrF family